MIPAGLELAVEPTEKEDPERVSFQLALPFAFPCCNAREFHR
jgi:hypothetical protein